MINPAFLNFPEEAKLLGEMVIGYGELDLLFVATAGDAIKQRYALLHAANQVRSETQRLAITHAMSHEAFVRLGMGDEYERVRSGMHICLGIRNQWAHSQWADLGKFGLGFTRADGEAFASSPPKIKWERADLKTLEKQQAFFEHIRLCIQTIQGNLPSVFVGRQPPLPMPPKSHQPPSQGQWGSRDRAQIEKGHAPPR